jgi:hypothetical protein
MFEGNWKTLKMGRAGAVAGVIWSAGAAGGAAGVCAEAATMLKVRREARVRENRAPGAKAHFFD